MLGVDFDVTLLVIAYASNEDQIPVRDRAVEQWSFLRLLAVAVNHAFDRFLLRLRGAGCYSRHCYRGRAPAKEFSSICFIHSAFLLFVQIFGSDFCPSYYQNTVLKFVEVT